MSLQSSDTVHMRQYYKVPESNTPFGIPQMIFQQINPADVKQIIGVGNIGKKIDAETKKDTWVHFFTDDFRFEKYWNKPWDGLKVLQQYAGCTMPDFSMYADWPLAINMWQVYRTNWLGRFWQEHGVKVIPVVRGQMTKAHEAEYTLAGHPKGMPFSIMHFTNRTPESDASYYDGLRRAIQIIEPEWILVFSVRRFLWSAVYRGQDMPEKLPKLYHAEAKRFAWGAANIAPVVEG